MNPSYRIDHEGSAEGGSDVRGAVLLMLCDETASGSTFRANRPTGPIWNPRPSES